MAETAGAWELMAQGGAGGHGAGQAAGAAITAVGGDTGTWGQGTKERHLRARRAQSGVAGRGATLGQGATRPR